MSDNSNLHDFVVKVAVMEQNISNIHVVFGRLESAIEKIGDVSIDIKQMLAVHEERIETLGDKITHNNTHTLMINESVATDIKELRERIAVVNQDFTHMLHTTETKILENQDELEIKIVEGQKELMKYFIEHSTALEKRVKVLEKWRYVLVGIFMVMGMVISIVVKNRIIIDSIVP